MFMYIYIYGNVYLVAGPTLGLVTGITPEALEPAWPRVQPLVLQSARGPGRPRIWFKSMRKHAWVLCAGRAGTISKADSDFKSGCFV